MLPRKSQKMPRKRRIRRWTTAVVLVHLLHTPLAATAAASCPPPGTSLSLTGSWVVQPIVTLWADFFDCPGVSVDVERSNNEEGIVRVCGRIANPTDIGIATRVLRDDEATKVPGSNHYYQCVGSERQIVEVDVALDGLAIVTAPGGTASNCLRSLGGVTVDQLRWMFSNWTEAELIQTGTWDRETTIPNSDGNPATRNWCELSSACPCVPISIAGASPDTRAHQYMQECTGFVSGAEGFSASYSYFPVATDLIAFLDASPAAVGYMRFPEFNNETSVLDAVPVVDPNTNTSEAVRPTTATIAGDQYNPYSRRGYMYVWTDVIDEVLPFVEFGFSDLGTSLVDQVNLVPLPLTERQDILAELQQQPSTTVIDESAPSSSGATFKWSMWVSLLLFTAQLLS